MTRVPPSGPSRDRGMEGGLRCQKTDEAAFRRLMRPLFGAAMLHTGPPRYIGGLKLDRVQQWAELNS